MINIAHPDFREEILNQVKAWFYVYSDQALPVSVGGFISIYPDRYETTFTGPNGEVAVVSPVKPTDERALQELYYSLNERDRYYRFFAPVKEFRHKKIQPLVNIDYSRDIILVCEYTSPDGEVKFVGSGGFFKTEDPSKGELAFTTHEEWRQLGLAKFLLQYLIQIAREQGYRTLIGTILVENRPMLHIIQTAGYPIENYCRNRRIRVQY